jgi:hypothetical protein
MMKAAEERNGHDRSDRLHRTAEWGVLVESQMCAKAIVIVGIGAEDPAQVDLAHDDDMVQAFSPD